MNLFGPWGLLPVAFPLLALTALLLARRLFHDSLDRLAAVGVVGMAVVHVSVGVLGTFGVLSAPALLAPLVVAVLVLVKTSPRLDTLALGTSLRATWPALTLGSVVVISAIAAARLLPVWQWDSLGYHLPFVNFVVQARGFAGVPPDVHYTSTYPHDIELGMVWLRLMLPDDRLIDLAQLPYGVVGALLTTAIARRLGAGLQLASLSGAAWLTLPTVFLQLPTNYVDIGTAAALLGAVYFLLLSPLTRGRVLLGGIALGLFLGSKPSAPMATALVGAIAALRCVQSREWRGLIALTCTTVVLGAEMYGVMLVRHGNPVWPVALQLGPLHLPGEYAMGQLLSAGAALPHATGTLLERLTVSWLALDTHPVFDMKVGGLGLPFLLALPVAIAGVVTRRSALLVLALVATLLSPDASIARYVLAFGALVLALAVATLERVPRRRGVVVGVMLLACTWQLHAAWPGLVGDGPPLQTLWSLSDEQRRVAVGPQGRPTDYPHLWSLVKPGESIAFDADFEFPGLLWAPDLRSPVSVLTDTADATWLEARHVRVVAVGPRHRQLVEAGRWHKLFDCVSADCAVYAREDDSRVAAASEP